MIFQADLTKDIMTQKKAVQARGAIVVVGSPKGGVGKSALAWEVAQGYARAGARVVLIDGDETATVATKYDNRQAAYLKDKVGATVVIAPKNVESTVLDMAKNVDLVVVDLGARDWDRYRTLPTCADLWLIPTDFAADNMGPAATLFAERIWPKRDLHVSGRPLTVRLAWVRTPTHAAANAAALARNIAWWKDAIQDVTGLEAPADCSFHPDTGFDFLESQLRLRNAPWDFATSIGAALEELPARVGASSALEVTKLLSEIQALLQGKE